MTGMAVQMMREAEGMEAGAGCVLTLSGWRGREAHGPEIGYMWWCDDMIVASGRRADTRKGS